MALATIRLLCLPTQIDAVGVRRTSSIPCSGTRRICGRHHSVLPAAADKPRPRSRRPAEARLRQAPGQAQVPRGAFSRTPRPLPELGSPSGRGVPVGFAHSCCGTFLRRRLRPLDPYCQKTQEGFGPLADLVFALTVFIGEFEFVLPKRRYHDTDAEPAPRRVGSRRRPLPSSWRAPTRAPLHIRFRQNPIERRTVAAREI